MARRQEFSEDLDDGDTGPSKSELKRQDRDLRELGVALVELPLVELEALQLPEKLLDAVMACRTIRAMARACARKSTSGKSCATSMSNRSGTPSRSAVKSIVNA